jgi:hypothetical protein
MEGPSGLSSPVYSDVDVDIAKIGIGPVFLNAEIFMHADEYYIPYMWDTFAYANFYVV